MSTVIGMISYVLVAIMSAVLVMITSLVIVETAAPVPFTTVLPNVIVVGVVRPPTQRLIITSHVLNQLTKVPILIEKVTKPLTVG
jgi:hypothetical protein